jgi:pimeloyl-ACP methyl ester carboxylesterase
MEKTFVLVGGAGLGGWAWQGVAAELRRAGHAVYPVTLTGLGERAHLARPEIDLETHVADVLNLLAYEDLADVVLVGHSYAGIVVQAVADRVPERLAALVYVDSGPLADGTSHLDFYPPEAQQWLREQVQAHGEGWRVPFPSFDDLGATASLAGLGEAARALLRARAVPHPFGSYVQPLRLRGTFAGGYARVLVLCTDGGFTAAQVRELVAADHPQFRPLADPDWQLHELPTGHWPMLSAPRELAALLARVAEPVEAPAGPRASSVSPAR